MDGCDVMWGLALHISEYFSFEIVIDSMTSLKNSLYYLGLSKVLPHSNSITYV